MSVSHPGKDCLRHMRTQTLCSRLCLKAHSSQFLGVLSLQILFFYNSQNWILASLVMFTSFDSTQCSPVVHHPAAVPCKVYQLSLTVGPGGNTVCILLVIFLLCFRNKGGILSTKRCSLRLDLYNIAADVSLLLLMPWYITVFIIVMLSPYA